MDIQTRVIFAYGSIATIAHIGVSIYLAYLVKRDRERLNTTIGIDVSPSLGPNRWAVIVLLTGVLGLAAYWFRTYHSALLTRLKN